MATFAPPIDPYDFILGSKNGGIYSSVYDASLLDSPAVLKVRYHPQMGSYGEIGEYPLSLYVHLSLCPPPSRSIFLPGKLSQNDNCGGTKIQKVKCQNFWDKLSCTMDAQPELIVNRS